MYGPKNRKGALWALAAAGGLWAWQNRSKIQGWIGEARSQVQSNMGRSHAKDRPGYTGDTRRMTEGEMQGDRPSPRMYDPSI